VEQWLKLLVYKIKCLQLKMTYFLIKIFFVALSLYMTFNNYVIDMYKQKCPNQNII